MYLTPAKRNAYVRPGGNYQVAGATGLLTIAAAASDIVSFRWADTTQDCVVWWIKWWWYLTVGFTAAQISDHALYKAKLFSASPSGGTSLLPAVGQNMMKTGQQNSLLTAFQISTTGALTTGTRTLETQPLLTRGAWCVAATLKQLEEPVGTPLMEPLYLTANEGWVIQNITTMGAAGVQKFHVAVAWSEIAKDSMYIADELVS